MRKLLAISVGCALLAAAQAHADPIINLLMKHPPCNFGGQVDHTGWIPHERAHSDHGGTVDLATGTMRLWARTDISSAGALFNTVTAEANGHAGFTGFDCVRTGRYRIWVQSLASGLQGVHVPQPPWGAGGAGGETNNWITITVHVWMFGTYWQPIAWFNVGAASNPPRDRGTEIWQFDGAVGESMAGEVDLYAGSTYALEATFHAGSECSSWGWIEGAWAAVNLTPLQDYWFAGTSYTRDGWWRLTGLGFEDASPDRTWPTTWIASGPPGGTYCSWPGLVWLAASDGDGYGVRAIYYQVDEVPWQEYSLGSPVIVDRSLTLRFYSVDHANNVEPVNVHRYTVISVLGIPTLLSVPDGSTGHTDPVVVSWSGVADATHYQLQVDDDPAFGSPLVGLVAKTDTSLAGLPTPATYYWRVRAHNAQAPSQCAWGSWPAPWSFSMGYPVGVVAPIPARFALWPGQPNPSRAGTSIAFDLPRTTFVSLMVYGVTGERIRELASGTYPAGQHRVTWDGRNDDGRQASSGTYFCRLTAGGFKQTRKMQLLR